MTKIYEVIYEVEVENILNAFITMGGKTYVVERVLCKTLEAAKRVAEEKIAKYARADKGDDSPLPKLKKTSYGFSTHDYGGAHTISIMRRELVE